MDYDDEVLYVYEIQLEECARRKGLGKFMMTVLELLSHKADMRKIMLTCFKHNPLAHKFFKVKKFFSPFKVPRWRGDNVRTSIAGQLEIRT